MSSDDESSAKIPEDNVLSSNCKHVKSDVNVAFGPQNWYWARCGTRWRFVRSQLSDWADLGIHDAHWVAFKHDTGFLIGGEDEDGEVKVVHTWNNDFMVRAEHVDSFIESRDAYIKLHGWIWDRVKSDPEKLRDIAVSIGPKGSYFARSGSSSVTHALPKDLQTAIKESDSSPMTIALGIKGSWIVLWADGTRSWNLRFAYPSLASAGHLENSSNRTVFAALNPYMEDSYFVVAEDGACSYSTSLTDNVEGKQLHEITDTYMRMRAKRDGSSFNHSMRLNGVLKQVSITPKSSPQETRSEALMSMWRARARQDFVKQKDVAFVCSIAGGTGVLAKVAGMSTMRAVGLATSTGIGAALSMWFRGN
ncbi:hypothetical protein P153DRAFT_391319 [Dothidotthia symphoricarpi CBS 119687]|uniref:Uncharacterized protein n=1 Tax=Dothidotthia symphoricarpi CBS 119687 TaxID=1392245 RepID=A0A6A5ZY63_9PLEO|nr:uncharacterized protein P153DRAFT_391319 [Dothidotthia symphoricarpi CBS 119687]KAF2123717.1 hypothetical protein P153DRAFT_391319 [Dothidotthia symphoricarpi CBS 119687]